MRRGSTVLLGVLTLGGLCGCPPPEEELSAQTVAAAFGLVHGRAMHYAVEQGGSTTEDHEYARSNSYAERLVIDRTEKAQGWVQDVVRFEAVADSAEETGEIRMIAAGDCLPTCLDYAPPVVVATYPWTAGARSETSSVVTVQEGDQSSTHDERHVFTMGSEGALSTEGGDFDVYEIGWQRFVDDGAAEYGTLYLAPEVGLVGIDRFDGASLRLTSWED